MKIIAVVGLGYVVIGQDVAKSLAMEHAYAA